MTLRTLNYGNYGIFLIMGHAGFCPSTVVLVELLSRGQGTNHIGTAPADRSLEARGVRDDSASFCYKA